MKHTVGLWLCGLIGATVVGAALGWLIWDAARKNTERMEGGWTRVVTDENLSYWGYALPTIAICLALWTLGQVAYSLMESGQKKR